MSQTAPAIEADAVDLPEIPKAASDQIVSAYLARQQADAALNAVLGIVLATLDLDPATHAVSIEAGRAVIKAI